MYTNAKVLAYFLVYVDDLILTVNDSSFLQTVVDILASKFSLKDLCPLSYFLGVEVIQSKSVCISFQRKYVSDVLAKYNMLNCKVCKLFYLLLLCCLLPMELWPHMLPGIVL